MGKVKVRLVECADTAAMWGSIKMLFFCFFLAHYIGDDNLCFNSIQTWRLF